MNHLSDFIFHLDTVLKQLVALHPMAVYLAIAAIIFCESAFFPTAPFLPGDGLLFSLGLMAAGGELSLWIGMVTVVMAAAAGNEIAYRLGNHFGPILFDRFSWLQQKHYRKAHKFYQDYGNRALLVSRFLPVVRALVPFVAGVVVMSKKDFHKHNIISVSIWAVSITLLAFFLGHIPVVKQHFAIVLFSIVCLSSLFFIILGFRAFLKRPAKPNESKL